MSQRGVYWLTRLHIESRLLDAAGQTWTIANFLKERTSDTIDVCMTLGPHHRLPCRVLAWRVPMTVAAKRRRRLRQEMRRRRGKVHPDRWALAEWDLYVTNIPVEKLSLQEARVLARCRWQIELLFKLWKSEGHVDESRSNKPWRVLCEVYAKLLGMVVQHWMLLVSCWSHPNRSLVKASRTVRLHAPSVATVLPYGQLVFRILENVRRSLLTGCRINRRRRAPPTHQLLLGLTQVA
jgi:hypothetical protein